MHRSVAPADVDAAEVAEQEGTPVGAGADLLVAGLDGGAEEGLAGLVDHGDHVADRHVDVVDGDAEAAELVAVLQVVGEGGIVVDAAGPQAGAALAGRGRTTSSKVGLVVDGAPGAALTLLGRDAAATSPAAKPSDAPSA